MPGSFDLIRDNYRLVPFGNDLYGMSMDEGYQTYSDDGTLNTNFDEAERHLRKTPEMVVKFNKDEYRIAKEKHGQYWSWKKNRNAKRGVLEEEFGYDTKHAMHLVRLLRMAREILKTGEVLVKRPDAEELLAIRGGAWTYEDLLAYSESMDKEIREVLYPTTSLPKKPNVKRAAEILMTVQDSIWSKSWH